VRDVWDPDSAFPDLPPLRLGRELDIELLQQRDEESLVDLVLSRKDALRHALRVWLDDSRPAPPGWLRVTAVPSAQRLLDAAIVQEISLDYDLGWCPDCIHQGEHLKQSGRRHCPHTLTGHDLVLWMADTGQWPQLPPNVHSGNLDGGARMLGVIAAHWRGNTRVTPDSAHVTADADAPKPVHQPAAASPLEPAPAAISTLTMCPNCHGPHIYRTHRHSTFQRVRSVVTRRHPVRCAACGWTRWVHDPIVVRFNAGDETGPPIDNASLDLIDPDESAPASREADPVSTRVAGH
jgi:cytochrome c553